MKFIRKILFWCHLAVGVCTALVVVIMAATGVLLTYQKQVTAWADSRSVDARPPVASAPRLPVEVVLDRAGQSAGAAPTALTLRSDPTRPADVSFGRDKRQLVNVYTGATLGEGSAGARSFFRWVTSWHRTLGATSDNRNLARQVTGAANIGFLFLVVSGFYLWWPRNWSPAALRIVTLFRRRLSGKARDFNWHNVIGFWSAIPLAIVVASGVVISYRWAGNLVYRAAGEQPPAAAPAAPRTKGVDGQITSAGLGALLARAEQRMPGWTSITVQLPTSTAKTTTFSLDAGTGGQPQRRAQLVLDRASGNEVKWEPFASQSAGRRWRSIARFAHTGEVLGLFGQTVAGLASLGAVVLAVTGVMLSLRRLAAWRRRSSLARTSDTDQRMDLAA